MKKLLVLLSIVFAACNNEPKSEQQISEQAHTDATAHSATTVPLNNGNKWKADDPTKKNVGEMVQVVNENIYADAANRTQLHAAMQTKIDTLIVQCKMQGPEHDALHVWLENVLKDMKELKDEDSDYTAVYARLKKDIEDFNTYFE